MLVVTTPILEGKKILEYKGSVFNQTVRGTGFGRSLGAGFKQFSGGRSKGHEELIIGIREEALGEMMEDARHLGANAIVGLTIDYEMLANDTLLLCKAFGTAVIVE